MTSTAAVKAYRLRKHAQHRAHPERTPHGTRTGYENYGCRCVLCTIRHNEVAYR